jgi:FkbM family methyltransferase
MLPNWIKDRIAVAFPRQWVQWVIWRSPKEAEWSYLERIVPPGMVSVDVGANIGVYTAALAKLTPMVHAFEPSPRTARLLRKRGLPNVCVHQEAVSDKPGTATLRTPIEKDKLFASSLATLENKVFDRFTEENISLSVLDDVISEPVGFIKIDVEGHELKVLNGALRIIETHRPIFLVECEERHGAGNVRGLFTFFAKMQYFGYFLKKGHLTSIDEFCQSQDQIWGVSNPYIYNFFFFPTEATSTTFPG